MGADPALETELKVISGAQVGADIAGLRAAKKSGLRTGGFMPLGWRYKFGERQLWEVELYELEETVDRGYPTRTEKNVRASDATIRLAYDWYSPGERLTQRLLIENDRPRFDIELRKREGEWTILGFDELVEKAFARTVTSWLLDTGVEVVNIAGNADASIEPVCERFLTEVFMFYCVTCYGG